MRWISNLFMKSYIITSFVICSIFVAVLSFSQLTFAQPDFDRSDGSTVVVPMEIDVLWDQTENASDTDIVSQDFIDVIFDTFDSRAADDFLIPEAFLWKVETVKVFGTFDGAAPDSLQSLDVVFYTDEGGLPGNLVNGCNFVNILPVDLNDPSFLINLPTPCFLRSGTYWMSVRANMLFLPNGQWFWNENTVQTLSPFVWENPGDGFGTGCTTFSYALAECGADFPDLSFQLMGEEQPFPNVPVLNTFGLIILFISFGLVLVIYYRKMKKNGL
ncbi:MAG: hypothetical protein DHS20C13_03750 [Thermodesulfobacteriota bacterium]|nr:MAG: hypothetical protein DHS20C13_03750 [Thermodesulfobacteriota bacterium]